MIVMNDLNKVTNCTQKNLILLYVEDELETRESYIEVLQEYSNEIYVTNDGIEGLELYKKHNPDIVISGIEIPGMNGIEMSKAIKQIDSQQPIIFTADAEHIESSYLLEAINMEAAGYILNPEDKEKLKTKIENITKDIMIRNENIRQKKVLQTILDNQSSLVILTDFDDILFASNSFLDFFDIKNIDEFFQRYESVLDMFIRHEDYLHADDKDEFISNFKAARAIRKVVLLLNKSFDPKAFHIHMDEVKDYSKPMYVVSLTNISIMQKINIETAYKAYTDSLTGVYNRLKFEEVFEFEFLQLKRYGNPISIALLDIDHFKKFNDTYGHLIGDEVLIMLAHSIQNNIRKSDLFARWGGEEFILLMTETDAEQAIIACEHLRYKIEELRHKTAGGITSSFGVTELLEDDTLESALKRCDDALYRAKANGRNRVEAG